MKRLSLQFLILLLASLVPVAAAHALPSWLPGTTVVASAGPQADPMMVTAMMLEANSASVVENPDGSVFHFWGRRAVEGIDVSGTWDLTIDIGEREMERTLVLEYKQGKVSGKYEGGSFSPEIKDLKLPTWEKIGD